MATVMDYLNAPEFTDDRLTEAINVAAYDTGRPAQLGIFRDVTIPTTFVRLGITEDEIAIIPSRERGGESNVNMRKDRGVLNLDIPHFPLDDAISPADLQNILQWGETYAFTMLGEVVTQKQAAMRMKHERTWHHLDWGALKGLIVDAEGVVLANLYTEFGIAQPSQAFSLGTAGTNVPALLRSVKARTGKELRGSSTSGIRIFAGSTWFDAFVSHGSVTEALKYYMAPGQPNPNRDDVVDEFRFAGVTIERVDEEFAHRRPDGTFEMLAAVPANEALAVPMGTDYFRRYIAPPDSIDLANRAPRPENKIFVSTNDLPHGKGKEIHTESNILPICTRPQIITRLTM
ncbi:major capsid protein [Paracoccus yeei]|uniref:Major capsid protein E n=1 Tax=Paracoccus yeei TaxID=147645 RepID=A0A2D2C107_9RHOB|nr:major capsid protein [Paracoccus yeei]ATQ56200.1 major capsid protein E [Paracoccus yeei]